jgi:GxxExxY protein
MDERKLNRLAAIVLNCGYCVHTALGPGLLESAYKACLAIEIANAGLFVEIEPAVPLVYAGQKVADVGYRMDLLVERELVVEIKSVEALHPIHSAQLLSYLRLGDKRLGLLLNFNTVRLRDGVKRVVNKL